MTYHTRPEVLMVGPHGSFYLGRVRRKGSAEKCRYYTPLTHGLWVKATSRNWRSPNHAGLSLGFCASRERSYCRAEIVPQHPSKSTDGSKHSTHRALSAWKPEDLTWTTKTTTGFGNFFRVRMFRCLKSYCSYQKHFALQPTKYRALSPKRHDLSHKRRSS